MAKKAQNNRGEKARYRLLPPKPQASSLKPREGFTLAELLVVMAILLILFNLLIMPMMMSLKLTAFTRAAAEAQDRGRGALEQMQRDVARAMLVYAPLGTDEFSTSRLDLVMPKTDPSGNVIQPLSPSSQIVRYFLAPARLGATLPEGWPKYWNTNYPANYPGNVGVSPNTGMGVPTYDPTTSHLYTLYRVTFDLNEIQNRTSLSADLPAGEVTTISVADASGFSASGTVLIDSEQIAYSSHTTTTFNGLTRGVNGTTPADHLSGALVIPFPTYPLNGCDPRGIYFYDNPNPSPVKFGTQTVSYSFWWRRMSQALTPEGSTDAALYVRDGPTGAELVPMMATAPDGTGTTVAVPGFSALPTSIQREQLVPNDRQNPTKYFGSRPLWSTVPAPIITLSNGNPPAGQEFWTLDLNVGSVDFAIPRTEYYDGGGLGTPSGDGQLIQETDVSGAYSYQVSMSGVTGLDRNSDGIPDFVLVPGSDKVQVIDSSGNISDYARVSDLALLQDKSYYIDYNAGKITFVPLFNAPANDIILQFQYRRNLIKKADGSVVNDNVLASYSSLALLSVRLNLATYSMGGPPADEFPLSSRLRVGNAPR